MLSATAYARLSPRQARAVLAVIAITAVLAVVVTLSPLSSSNLKPKPREAGDVALYRAEVDRIRTGEGYYEAAAAELAARKYPTRSVFNWRTPLPVWLLGKLPTPEFGKALLGVLALAIMLLAFETLVRDGNHPTKPRPAVAPGESATKDGATTGRGFVDRSLWRPIACALWLTGPLMPTVLDNLFVLPVLWAGVLIALSACAYGVGRVGWGVGFGLAAVFFRELALPYAAVCAWMAWRGKRRAELAAWIVGLAAWVVFFGLHWWHVSGLITPDARAHRQGWILFGGAGFVISTAQMNAYLLLVPQWVTALYLVAAMVGLAGWNTPLGERIGLSVCLFLMAFGVVGHSFNQYWGSLIAPLLCFGVVRFPASMRDLCVAVRGSALHGH